MSVASDYSSDRGPNSIEDLDALPDEGKGYELVHGWLIPMSPSMRHDHVAERLKDLLQPHVPEGYLVRGPWDVQMPDGSIYKPDVAVLDAAAYHAGLAEDRRALLGSDVLLAAEVQRPGSGSWKVVHGSKVRDYAVAGIPHYWIIDLDEAPALTVYQSGRSLEYSAPRRFVGDEIAELSEPFPIALSPAHIVG
ncbi:Uma2 family endonuclease [Actinomadura hibisca]|uniref:Uma2 family endonuclease n=1 Tax=Actinomadura hibisca TaxID=68565 RepID=UPI00082C8B94|nr:Uma2 family endonuclease [Actinomadura hibisca]